MASSRSNAHTKKKKPYRFVTQYVCMNLRGLFLYFFWDYRVCHFLTASFPGSSLFPLSIYLVRCYDVFLCNEERKNSIEDCLNLTCFRTFTALHWKRDVSKEPFQFILETSYRWLIKYLRISCVSILALL